MNSTRWFVLALLALTLAACGSDSASDDKRSGTSTAAGTFSPPDTVSKAQLVAEADKICQETGTKVKTIRRPRSKQDYPALQKAAGDNAGVLDTALARFRGLGPPDAVKPDYDAFVAAFGALTDQTHELADAAKDGDAGRITAAFAKSQDQTPVTLSRKLGFKQCSG